MDINEMLCLWLFLMEICIVETVFQVYTIKGSSVQLNCPHRATTTNEIKWSYSRSYPTSTWTAYTINEMINPVVSAFHRLNITGDSSNGEYNLKIIDLKGDDDGYYQCFLSKTTTETVQQLIIVVGPSSVALQKTDKKLVGIEGQSLQIICTAVGGDPVPNVQILRSGSVVISGKQTVTYTTPTLQRSDDGQTVTCRAGYIQMNSFPIDDSAVIHLDLKPLSPQYSQASPSFIEGHMIDISCTSTGSRPAAVFNWYIDSANITNSSVTSSTADQTTFTVTSRLRFTLTKDHNRKTLICKAINSAAPSGVEPYVPITVNVLYPPSVTVNDNTVTDETFPVVMACTAEGNPDTYTYYEWTHESLQGALIRRLTGTSDGKLTLSSVNTTLLYQNTGRYTCTVGNGIPDTGTRRTGSGVLTVNAPPVLALYNSWTQGGEIRKTVDISVDVYSVPPPLNFIWHREETQVSGSGYKTSSSQAIVKVMFHEQEVEVSGYKATLTIVDVKESDFTAYKIRIINSRGSIEQDIQLNSSNAPDQPKNVTIIGQTYETITLQWEAGYDGGHEQTFYIKYSQQGTGKWTTVMGPKGVSGGTGQIYQTVIGGLLHSTVYEITMFAQNQINKSSETMIEIGLTDPQRDAKASHLVTGVAIGLSLTVIVVVISAFLVYRFIVSRKQISSVKDKTSSGIENSAAYDNITDPTGTYQNETNETYETLGTKDTSNVYEALCNKSKGDKKAKNPGEINKPLKMDNQPNVYEDLNQQPTGIIKELDVTIRTRPNSIVFERH